MFNSLHLKNTFTCTGLMNKLQLFYATVAKNGKFKDPVFCKSYHCSPTNAFKIRNTRNSTAQAKSDALNVNTNVRNNVLLFKYENSGYFLGLKLFSIGWLCSSALLAYYTYTPQFKLIWSDDLSWIGFFKKTGGRIIYFIFAVIAGPAVIATLHFSTKRFIKYIILHKGGKNVSIITHHLYNNERLITVPVEKVRSTIARCDIHTYLPLRIRGNRFYYLLDSKGRFLNGKLFDNTIGVARTWK